MCSSGISEYEWRPQGSFPYDPTLLLLGVDPKEAETHRNLNRDVHSGLFIIPNGRTNPDVCQLDELTNKMWDICTMKCYQSIKRNKVFFLLKYSWFTVFQVNSQVSQLYIYVSILLQFILHCRLLQNIEYSSQCYRVDPCWLSILYIVVCIC